MMLVNICMITYNHEAYISQAIESILGQVTDFAFQLVIGEDYSTDNTRQTCMDYATRYPEKIKLVPSSANVGMMQNFLQTYSCCTAKYIAFCEGDDYWTDTAKLQKQVTFLEANAAYSGCFHNVIIKEQRKNELAHEWVLHPSLSKESFDTEDVLGPWFIASPSFIFVNYPGFVLPDWFYNCRYGDLAFMLLLTLKGKFKYIDEVMAVYRKHDMGVSEMHKAYDKIMVMTYLYCSFDIHTSYKYHATIRKAVAYEIERHVPPPNLPEAKPKNFSFHFTRKYYLLLKEKIYKQLFTW